MAISTMGNWMPTSNIDQIIVPLSKNGFEDNDDDKFHYHSTSHYATIGSIQRGLGVWHGHGHMNHLTISKLSLQSI
jgi:hypothetical protein